MRAWTRATLLLTAISFLGCSDDDPTGTTGPDGDGNITTTLVAQLDTADWRTDPFTLLEAAIDGDTLSLQVGYGGGCRFHQFGLVISNDFMESHPVQTRALLAHDADGDLCEAYILTWLIADLAPLKLEWQTAYQADTGAVVLHLDVPVNEAECDTLWSGPGRCSLLYSF
jgi:hypothetical protein